MAFLAGCSVNANTPPLDGSGAVTPRHSLAHSWMRAAPKGTTGTIWADDVEYATVDKIAYPSGTLIGQVAGFSYPYGNCSDSRGNVYVTDFSAEKGFEIQAGTTNIINSWSTGGETIGCSVSNGGDVAFSNFDPGGVIVFPGGGPTGIKYPGPGADFGAGYDANGNLFVVCAYQSPCSYPRLAELPAGGSSWILLNFNGALVGGSVQSMGKYLGIGGSITSVEGAIELVRVSGSQATVVKTMAYDGSGCSAYMNFSSSWASINDKPNGVITKKPKDVGMPNDDCFGSPILIFKMKRGSAIKQFLPISYQYDEGVTFTKP